MIEGQLRDLALAEVLQLLWVSRKTGSLHVRSSVEATEATISFDRGWITAVSERGMFDSEADGVEASAHAVDTDFVLDMLRWTEGEFHFDAHAVASTSAHPRVSTELLIMEGARRADAWTGLRDLIKGPREIPAFPDVQPQQLSLLHLVPEQWEILTQVDGVRTIEEISRAMGRELIEVATTVHQLIESGVLVLRDAAPLRRAKAIPTPISTPAIRMEIDREVPRRRDYHTIPPVYSPVMPFALPFEAGGDDSLFDPMQLGVMTPDGMPALPPEESPRAELEHPRAVGRTLRAGDEAANRGDFIGAAELWSQWLELCPDASLAAEVHERIALARRLHALLQS